MSPAVPQPQAAAPCLGSHQLAHLSDTTTLGRLLVAQLEIGALTRDACQLTGGLRARKAVTGKRVCMFEKVIDPIAGGARLVQPSGAAHEALSDVRWNYVIQRIRVRTDYLQGRGVS